MKMNEIDVSSLCLRRRGDDVILSMERRGRGWLKVFNFKPDTSIHMISVSRLAICQPDEELNK